MTSHYTNNISEAGDTQRQVSFLCADRLTVTQTGQSVNQFQTTVTRCCISPPSKKSLIKHKQQQLLRFFPQRQQTPIFGFGTHSKHHILLNPS